MGFYALWRELLGSIQVQGSYLGMGRRVDRGEDSRKGQRKEGFEGLPQGPGGEDNGLRGKAGLSVETEDSDRPMKDNSF